MPKKRTVLKEDNLKADVVAFKYLCLSEEVAKFSTSFPKETSN